MSIYKLHAHPLSSCGQRVLVSLLQMGLVEGKDFEYISHKLPETKTPEWLAIQPFGQMPYFEDTNTGAVLYESRAIARYVAGRTRSPLLVTPADDAVAFAEFEIAASVELANFHEHAQAIVTQLVLIPNGGGQSDKAVVKYHVSMLEKRLPVFDQILSKQNYMAGEDLTLVDLWYLPYGTMLAQSGAVPSFIDGTHQNIKRWWDELSGLESWKIVMAKKAVGGSIH